MRDRDAVRALRDRLAADCLELVKEGDEPDYVSVKCREPGRLHRRGGMGAGAVNIDVQRDPCAAQAR
jgi:hypothetical protein